MGSYPRAILHFDGDAFFASVEQAKDWRLKGKPVVTGGERGAATSLSYEAKARGLHRGIPMQDIRRMCPDVIVVNSDYTAYSIYARRMYAIAKKYSDTVEEYSIDECFADITDLDTVLGMSYEAIARTMKEELERSLGITFGVGLASTKTLAKVASKHAKPAGLTIVPQEGIEQLLAETQIYDVWGLGGASSVRLRLLGVITALDYTRKDIDWLREHGFVRPQIATWHELSGRAVYRLSSGGHEYPHSVMKTRTFSPPSTDRGRLLSELSKNVEAACAKLRKEGMKARALSFYLKTQEFTYHGVQIDLPIPLSSPPEILSYIEERLDEVYAPGILYRATGVTLRGLIPDGVATDDIFGDTKKLRLKRTAYRALDELNKRYGRGTVFLASSMHALAQTKTNDRGNTLLKAGPQLKKSLNIPYLGTVR